MAQMELELGIDPSGTDLDYIMRSLEEDLSDCCECDGDTDLPGIECEPSSTDSAPKTDVTSTESSSSSSCPESGSSSSTRAGPVTRSRTGRGYNLRNSSLINRLQTEQRQASPRKPKPKARPPPLSKYRRRTANSRERNRMREINDAFDVLRDAIPAYRLSGEGSKMTKITTLRHALEYISALRDMLGYEEDMSTDGGSMSVSDATCSSPDSCRGGHMVSPSHSGSSSDGNLSPHTGLLDSEGESVHS